MTNKSEKMELEQKANNTEKKPWYTNASLDTINEKGKSNEDIYNSRYQSKDPIIDTKSQKIVPKDKVPGKSGGGHSHGVPAEHPTSYLETLMHLFKGNIGSGIFAMGDAIKNAGIILGPCVVLLLGIICVHCQHMLVSTSKNMALKSKRKELPDFAETVELSFQNGPERLRKSSWFVKRMVNTFLCITQLGFCCIYMVFISSNIKQVLDYYGYVMDVHLHMAIILLPILLTCLIRNLKYLAPLSTLANVFMLIGVIITIYYSSLGLGSVTERTYVANFKQFPLFFGTAVFAFEGIGLVLPLQNEMKQPKNFRKSYGVLNVGMTVVVTLYITIGFLSYLQYGDDIKGSVTLNLPQGDKLAQAVKVIISLGVLLTYSLQFYIAVDILWPPIKGWMGVTKYPVFGEMAFRTFLVMITFALAESIPFLELFISLVGAVSSSTLALLFPPLIDLVTRFSSGDLGPIRICKNVAILLFGVVGFFTGTYTSVDQIIRAFQNQTSV